MASPPTQAEARAHMLVAAEQGRDVDLNLLFYTMGDVAEVAAGPFVEQLLRLACHSGSKAAVVELLVQLIHCSQGMFAAQTRLDLLRRVMRSESYPPDIGCELRLAAAEAEEEAARMAARLMAMTHSDTVRRSGRLRQKPKRFKPK